MKPEAQMALGGRYRLVRQIAVGGMGEVWVAHDESLARDVAVKVLREEFAGNSDFLDRLRTEARNSAALSHSNIAQLYDYGEQQGSGYLVMELVHGEPMSDLLEREPVLPVLRLLSILSQTARALHAAHVAGVVHRDVKPGNILLERSGEVKITDFGVSLASNQIPMTAAGMVMGTAQYLSPEQAIGKAATGASDIYALGIVAYESIVGNRPFTGATPVDIAVAQVNEAVPPLPSTVHSGLADLVMRMLAKDPLDRPRSGAILARTFDLLADEIAADPWGNGRRRREPAAPVVRREAPPTAGVPATAPAAAESIPSAAAVPLAVVREPEAPAAPVSPGAPHEGAEQAPVGRRMLPSTDRPDVQDEARTETRSAPAVPPVPPAPSQAEPGTSEPSASPAAAPRSRHAEPTPPPAPVSTTAPAAPTRSETSRVRDVPPPPAPHQDAQQTQQWEPVAPTWDAVKPASRTSPSDRPGSSDGRLAGTSATSASEPTGSVRRRVPPPGTTARSRTTPVAGTPRAPGSSTARSPRSTTRSSANRSAPARSSTTRPATGRQASSSRRRGGARRSGVAGLLDTIRSVGWPTLALVLVLVVVLTATLAKALLDSSASGEAPGSGHLSGTISVESTGWTGPDAMIVEAQGSQSHGAASPTTPKDT